MDESSCCEDGRKRNDVAMIAVSSTMLRSLVSLSLPTLLPPPLGMTDIARDLRFSLAHQLRAAGSCSQTITDELVGFDADRSS